MSNCSAILLIAIVVWSFDVLSSSTVRTDLSPAFSILSAIFVRLPTFDTISSINSPIAAICAEAVCISSACETAPLEISSTALLISSEAIED